MKKALLIILITFFPALLRCQPELAYVGRILDNINQIRTASYLWHQSASVLYDTFPSLSYIVYKKEYINPGDTFAGAGIASFLPEDTTKLVYFYDGKAQSYIDWENKTIPCDSFQFDRYPYRIVYPPFFIFAKCLLKYSLETSDSIDVRVQDYMDSVSIRLTVFDKLVEVVGNRIVYAEPAGFDDERWTNYEIWVDKAKGLPFRLVKRFPDRTCWEVCRNIKTNTTDDAIFSASDYIPAGFSVKPVTNSAAREKNMTGMVAPGWKLKDASGNETELDGCHSKVVLLQFTGIGCGPCYQAIPCLRNLTNQYRPDDFKVVSIETWSQNTRVIQKYIADNKIDYQYLSGSREIQLNYAVQSVPRFFVLDQKRVIRKIINGYDRASTCTDLKEAIDRLLIEKD